MLYSNKIRPKELTPAQKAIYDQIKVKERYLKYCRNNQDLITVDAGGHKQFSAERDEALDYFANEVSATLLALDSLKEDFAAA